MGKHRGKWLVPGVLAVGLAVAGGTVSAGGAGAASSAPGVIGHAINIGSISTDVGPTGRQLRWARLRA